MERPVPDLPGLHFLPCVSKAGEWESNWEGNGQEEVLALDIVIRHERAEIQGKADFASKDAS